MKKAKRESLTRRWLHFLLDDTVGEHIGATWASLTFLVLCFGVLALQNHGWKALIPFFGLVGLALSSFLVTATADVVFGFGSFVAETIPTTLSRFREWSRTDESLFRGKVDKRRIEPFLMEGGRFSPFGLACEFVRDQIGRPLRDGEKVCLLKEGLIGDRLQIIFALTRAASKERDGVRRDTFSSQYFFLEAVVNKVIGVASIISPVQVLPQGEILDGESVSGVVDRWWGIWTSSSIAGNAIAMPLSSGAVFDTPGTPLRLAE